MFGARRPKVPPKGDPKGKQKSTTAGTTKRTKDSGSTLAPGPTGVDVVTAELSNVTFQDTEARHEDKSAGESSTAAPTYRISLLTQGENFLAARAAATVFRGEHPEGREDQYEALAEMLNDYEEKNLELTKKSPAYPLDGETYRSLYNIITKFTEQLKEITTLAAWEADLRKRFNKTESDLEQSLEKLAEWEEVNTYYGRPEGKTPQRG
ncbi:uncharacterized protein MKK02DRAFT_44445 [Dioszegia hungarica]|uniref:Uncharacterized protein n=1 Tax=Dioszegia hungarica TaxID=4972 RepID=A0AA38LUI5_9TREE|nr:uncharacterized protein MKK02DRAFT_44445 [Dioszegia hungarica]KAI9635745.1 hypothetical protein MKK02DRAFT_44445 [Dioszegia hungarica]